MTPTDTVVKELMNRTAAAVEAQNPEEIVRLSALIDRARRAEQAIATFEQELANISAELQGSDFPERKNSRASEDLGTNSGEIRVEINWPALGVRRSAFTMKEGSGKRALVKFVQELRAGLGDTVLGKLATLRVSRGPLVSVQPAVDYRNPRRGYLYNHARLNGTPYALLTHSSTAEKIDIMRSAVTHLGLDGSKFQFDLGSS